MNTINPKLPRAILSLKLLMCGALLSACAGAPSVPEPSVDVPARWQSGVGQGGRENLSDGWWRDFGSAELNALVDQALIANRDLQIAAARVVQARALVGEVDSDRLPHLSAAASATKGREVTLDPNARINRAGFVASWETDLFGQKGLASRAAGLDAEGVELVRQATQTVVVALVASAYLDAAILSRRDALGRQRLALLEQAVETAQKQYVAGLATRVDIDRRRVAQQSFRTEVEQLHSALRQRLLQLTVLLGATPGSVQPDFADFDKMGFVASAPWLPSELLERRPDVRRQARELSAAAARVGLAKLDLYPKFVFSWANARENAQIYEQGAATDIALGYGISVSLPLFDSGRIRSRIKVSEARLQEAMAAYEKAMIEALADAETVLVRQAAWQGSLPGLAQSVAASRAAASNTQRLFLAGLADRGAVLDSEQALLQAQDARLQAEAAYGLANVDVCRAFSGSASGVTRD